MADLKPRLTHGAGADADHPGVSAESRGTAPAGGNHAPPKAASDPEPSPQATSSPPDDRSGLDRAEAFVDYLAERLSSLTSNWGRKFLRLSSRARESAQDFWADVQDFRQGNKP